MTTEETLASKIGWTSQLEALFASTGEKAHCFSWLHKRAEELFSRKTVFIDLPVIILSTINGAVSVGSSSLFGDSGFASIGVGCVALLTALLSTIGSYFSWARRAEAHKISSLNYAKLYRFISIEMSLPRHERMTPANFLKYIKSEYDRLSEISPLVPPSIVALFRARFGHLNDITFPEECNGLHAIEIYPIDPTSSPTVSLRHAPAVAPANVQMTRPPVLVIKPDPGSEIHAASSLQLRVPHHADVHEAHARSRNVSDAPEGGLSHPVGLQVGGAVEDTAGHQGQ